MQKKIKFFLTVLIEIFLLLISFNYIVFGELNFNGVFDSLKFLKENNYKSTNYKKEYIDKHENITITDTNTTGTIVYTYNLKLNDIPKDVFTLNIKLNSKKVNSNHVTIHVHTNDKIFTYDEDNFHIDDNLQKFILIQQENVNKIIIESVFEQYGGSEIVNKEVLSIDSIKINNQKDISAFKKNLLFDFFKSILITIIVSIVIFILVKTEIDKKIFKKNTKIEKIFLIVALVTGIIFSVLFPLYQVPDELTHINMIYEEFNLDVKFQNITNDYGDTRRIIRNYDEKVNTKEYFDLSQKIEFNNKLNIPSIQFVRHFPQAIGLIICSKLNLPVLISITIAEILAVLFYSMVCYLALKLIPIKKEVLMLIMLLPVCIQQMGSFSYDVVLLPICFLFTSYILYLKFTKDKIKIFDLLKLIGMLLIIALIKIPYVMLGGLILLLPPSKIYLDFKRFRIDGVWLKRHKRHILVTLGISIIPTFILTIKILKKISYGRVLIAIVKARTFSINLLFNTIKKYAKGYLKELTGNFGWFDTPVSIVFTIFILLSIIIITFFKNKPNQEKNIFKKWEVVYILFLAISMSIIIIISMFQWTLYVTGIPNSDSLSINEYANLIKIIPIIGGVQGRYFIPIIPLYLLPLSSKIINKIVSKINTKFYLLIYYIIVIIYMFFIILNRYWI